MLLPTIPLRTTTSQNNLYKHNNKLNLRRQSRAPVLANQTHHSAFQPHPVSFIDAPPHVSSPWSVNSGFLSFSCCPCMWSAPLFAVMFVRCFSLPFCTR